MDDKTTRMKRGKPRPGLMYWSTVYDTLWDHPQDPFVRLSSPDIVDCEITPNGSITLRTSAGGEYGDPVEARYARPHWWWQNLLVEVERVGRHYYGEQWGTEQEQHASS